MTWKHWVLTNLLSVSLALHTLRLLKLDTFQTGIILLSGLFLYDIFWVFGTDVMVTVARSFDAPIKIVFPTAFGAADPRLAMLGLGDRLASAQITALLKRGLLETDSPYGKLRLGVPQHALRFYFPSLWPEAESQP